MMQNHYQTDVPGLGNVAFSRHAQARMEQLDITEEVALDALHNGEDTPEGANTTWRERRNIRLVIITPTTRRMWRSTL